MWTVRHGAPARHVWRQRCEAKDALTDLASSLDRCRAVLSQPILPVAELPVALSGLDGAVGFYAAFERPPEDEDGFVRVALQQMSAQKRWEAWIKPALRTADMPQARPTHPVPIRPGCRF
jgi:hypothetical protein